MTMRFSSMEEAKSYVARLCKSDQASFQEVENLKAIGMEALLLDDPNTTEEVKKSIRERINAQKGFKFTASNGQEIKIVIGPFRDEFDCWVISPKGVAMRL